MKPVKTCKPMAGKDPARDMSDAKLQPLTVAYRRNETRQQLERLRNLLASDLPRTERAIVERQYERICQDAANLGVDID